MSLLLALQGGAPTITGTGSLVLQAGVLTGSGTGQLIFSASGSGAISGLSGTGSGLEIFSGTGSPAFPAPAMQGVGVGSVEGGEAPASPAVGGRLHLWRLLTTRYGEGELQLPPLTMRGRGSVQAAPGRFIGQGRAAIRGLVMRGQGSVVNLFAGASSLEEEAVLMLAVLDELP